MSAACLRLACEDDQALGSDVGPGRSIFPAFNRESRVLSAAVWSGSRQRDRDDNSLIAFHGLTVVVPVGMLP